MQTKRGFLKVIMILLVQVCLGGVFAENVFGQCLSPGAFAILSPANGATNASPSVTLSWGASSGVGSYILHIGTTNPPSPQNDQYVTGTSFTPASSVLGPLAAGYKYYWSVEAVASCDSAKKTLNTMGQQTFTVESPCVNPGQFSLQSPANGATNVSPSVTLSWGASSGAGSYILHIGTTNPPSPQNDQYVMGTSFTPASSVLGPLAAGHMYYWSVDAVASCDSAKKTLNTGGQQTLTICSNLCYANSVWVPVASHIRGAYKSSWRTDLGVLNDSGSTANYEVRLYTTTAGVKTSTAFVAAGGQSILQDVVAQLGFEGSGVIEVRSDQQVHVTSRTYNLVGPNETCTPNGTFGQDYASYKLNEGLSAEQSALLPQLTENQAFRSNIGLANFGSIPASVTVTLYDGAGARLTSYDVNLNPGEWKQENQPFLKKARQTSMSRGWAKVKVNSGAGVVAVGSVVDNLTNDPTTIQMIKQH